MSTRAWPLMLALCVACLGTLPTPALAKRAAPARVAPVTHGKLKLSAPRDRMGFVVATTAAGEEVWARQIYAVWLDPKLERDVQDVFIKTLQLKGHTLTITTERGHAYALDLKTLAVSPLKGAPLAVR